MSDFLFSIQNEANFYLKILKFLLYFFTGAIVLIALNFIRKLFFFIQSKFKIETLINHLNFIFKILVFMLVSTFIGWILIFILF